MFDIAKFNRVMDGSGLTKTELVDLYGASRQTLYTWKTKPPRQATLADRAGHYTDGLCAAMDRNLLPFPASTNPEQRRERLKRMAVHLHKLTAPKG